MKKCVIFLFRAAWVVNRPSCGWPTARSKQTAIIRSNICYGRGRCECRHRIKIGGRRCKCSGKHSPIIVKIYSKRESYKFISGIVSFSFAHFFPSVYGAEILDSQSAAYFSRARNTVAPHLACTRTQNMVKWLGQPNAVESAKLNVNACCWDRNK